MTEEKSIQEKSRVEMSIKINHRRAYRRGH